VYLLGVFLFNNMRIIRITSCFDCDPWKGSGVYCGKDGDISIHYHVYHKTLHEDCPLEEEDKYKQWLEEARND